MPRIDFENENQRNAFRHTASHILAQAVKRLYPQAKLAIGPAIENGFYYDFDTEAPFNEQDLKAIKAEMRKIVKENLPLERFELPREQAIKLMQDKGEPYKAQLISELPEDSTISFYKQGDFIDLCAGPHVLSTGMVQALELLSCTGAYWKGDACNKVLQRIYGTAFPEPKMLTEHLALLEEAKKRDHRKLGRELDLFDIYEQGPGFPFFLPKGMILRNLLEEFWRTEHLKRGYQEIMSPMMLDEELWHHSGHWDHYKDNMYFTKVDGGDYAIKPMNCPGCMIAYKRRMHSYRDFPQRIAEMGFVHRHELSGTLHGLMRVRCFTQDDAHIFMTPDQIESEVIGVIELIDYIYNLFGFEYHMELSTRPEKAMGTKEQWEISTNALANALSKSNREYKLNEGDGAFYGPKIDFHLRDSLKRTWQCGTIQLDFQMPERFDLTYVDSSGEKLRPVMLHRAVLGSIERFIAILTEHFAGAFPVWLSPEQVRILPITGEHLKYAEEVCAALTDAGFRAHTDERNEKTGFKIREAQLAKVPYMIILGDRETQSKTISVRDRRDGKTTEMNLEDLITKLTKLTNEKSAL